MEIKQESSSFCDDSIKESKSISEADSDIEENEKKNKLDIPRTTFQCNLCSKSYVRNNSFIRHQQTHQADSKEGGISEENKKRGKKKSTQDQTQNEETVIQCPMCSKSFSRPKITNFIHHLQKNHGANNKSKQDPDNDDKFHCPLCTKFFSSAGALHNHIINIHVKHKPVECKVCKSRNKSKRFIDQKSLDKHMRFVHRPKRVKCEICLLTFTHPYILNRHRKSHLGASNHKCKYCSKAFLFESQLHCHLVFKHKEKSSKVKSYTCDLCGNIFKGLSDLEKHVVNAHVVDKSVECHVCGKLFVNESHLARHFNTAHIGKVKVLTCDVCSQGFRKRIDLVRHLGVKHGRFFDCQKCSKSFGTKQDFDLHSVIVSDSAELQCQICLVVLPSPCSFSVHTKTHLKKSESKVNHVKLEVIEEKSSAHDSMLKEKQFKCDLCTKTFSRSLYLSAHRKQVHPGIKWECKVCAKTFKLQCNLTIHEKIHSLVRPFECNVCQKTFKSQGDLTGHKKIHDEVKRHKCLICQKSFTHAAALRLHMSNYHEGERPFKCHLCDKSWALKVLLKRHLLSHVQEKTVPCNKCEKYFKSDMDLKQHHRVVHLDIKKPKKIPGVGRKVLESNDDSLVFVCSICDFEMKDEKEVALHNTKHGLPKVLVSKAVVCSKHTSLVFPIKIENTSLESSSSINSNLPFIKKEEPSESFKCSLCSPVNSLPTRSVVSNSRTIRREFKCKNCCKLFAKKSSLNNHLKCHSVEKSNMCSGCSKQFSTSFNLRRHAKICGAEHK